MSDQPRPKRYIDLTLVTQVPGDSTEAMEAVRQHLAPAPTAEPGFTRQEQLETEAREAAAEELNARNRSRDELLTAAAQLRVEGAAVVGRFGSLLMEHVAHVGSVSDQQQAGTAYRRTLQRLATLGYRIGISTDDEPGESP